MIVLWDMGGIFQEYFTEVILGVGDERGWPLDDVPMGPTHSIPDPDYDAMCAGDLDEPDYLQVVIDRLRALGIDYHPVTDRPQREPVPREEVWGVIDEIAASDRRQAILTNDASRWMGEGWWEHWPQAPKFDAIVDARQVGIRKPAPEPFLFALERIEADPAGIVFVDDMPVNCRGAEAVGMSSVWFDITDPAGSVRRLRERIGL